jgi:hypothetical protein
MTGLTDREIHVVNMAGLVASNFSDLPVMHPADVADVVFHIHAIQNIVMARAAQRDHPKLFPIKTQPPEPEWRPTPDEL